MVDDLSDDLSLEELQKQRDALHEKSKKASKIDINSFTKSAQEKREELKTLKETAEEATNEILEGSEYRRNRADAWNARMGGVKNKDAEARINEYNEQIRKFWEPYEKARLEKKSLDQDINSYYHSVEDTDKLSAQITERLQNSVQTSQKNVAELEDKLNKQKAIEQEIQQIKQNQNKLEKKVFTFKSSKDKVRNRLDSRLSNLQGQLQKINPKNQDLGQSLEEERVKLKKAEESLANEQQKQAGIQKEIANFPKEMNSQKCVQDLAKEISELSTKTPQEKAAFAEKIKNTAPEILTAKFGEPPKTLLHVASEHRQGEVGVALLESPARFHRVDMQEALKIALEKRTVEQNKVITTNAMEQSHDEVKEVTMKAMRSMRGSLTNEAAKAPVPPAPVPHIPTKSAQQQIH